MNSEKRQFFKNMNLQLCLAELLSAIASRLPKDELVFKLSFRDARRSSLSNNETHEVVPPQLPSDLEKFCSSYLTDRYHVRVSDEQVTAHTVKVVPSELGWISQEKSHSYSVLDLIDP